MSTTKLSWQKMCLENNLSTIGTKLDLAKRLAKHLGVNLDHETPLYIGDLSSIPASVTQIRRLSTENSMQFHIFTMFQHWVLKIN